MEFTPLTSEDFSIISGSRIGANTVYERLVGLKYYINQYLKERNVEHSSIVANPVISRGKDIRKAGWLGYIDPKIKLPDPSLNPLSTRTSVSVMILGEGNFKDEEPGLQIVTEFGEGKRLRKERDRFFRKILNAEFIEFTCLGNEAALRLRGLPDTTIRLDGPKAFLRFQKTAVKHYNSYEHYAVVGQFLTVDQAVALGQKAAKTVAEAVRRLLFLFENLNSGMV
ncbi:hypothetical protein J7K50_05120 [bacterium]|nr:hypothetical protein [bacterium]